MAKVTIPVEFELAAQAEELLDLLVRMKKSPLVPAESAQIATNSVTTAQPPAHGEYWSGQGGYFAGIVRGPTVDGIEQPPFALLVADASTGEFEDVHWGEYGKSVDGAKHRSDGKANTEAMALAQCPAALKVRELTIDGHSDWYLPALGEMNTAHANVPELFSTSGWYWTSTQSSRYYAFVQGFEYGVSSWVLKGNEHRVRAFRRASLSTLTA